MNSIFGDATTVMPTPETLAEAESLFSGHARSPVPSLDLRRQTGSLSADSAIPGLDINPPAVPVKNGQPVLSRDGSSQGREGLGGWISSMVQRARGGGGDGDSSNGQYKRVDQDEEDR